MKSATAVIQQKLHIFLQNSNCYYWQNTTHLLLFIGLGIATSHSVKCQRMILQDNTHVCNYHWGFQAKINWVLWVPCVWTDQLRAKTHEIKHETDTYTQFSKWNTVDEHDHKNNHVIYELWMGILALSGFNSDGFTLLTFTTSLCFDPF